MSPIMLIAAGLCLELLFVVLPLVHLGTWATPPPTAWTFGTAALPVCAVLVSLFRPTPVFTLGLVPLSHAPVLLLEPRLTSPLVHAGPAGLGSWTLTVIAATAWCVASLQVAREAARGSGRAAPAAPASFLSRGPALGALVIWSVFLLPVVAAPPHGDTTGAVVATLMGLLVSIWVGYRWFGLELAELQQDPRARSRLRTQVLLRRRFSAQAFWMAAIASVVLGIVATLVYGAH